MAKSKPRNEIKGFKKLEKPEVDLTDTIGESQEDKSKRAVDEIRQRILNQQPKAK